jgi:tetratricopeptide (TPR) repeat protein
MFLVVKKTNDKMRPILIFFLTWLILGLLLHLQIFPLDMTVADRWFYLPEIGLLGLIGAFITIVIAGNPAGQKTKQSQDTVIPAQAGIYINKVSPVIRSSKFLIPASIMLITLLSLRAYIRIQNWQNGLTLFSHDAKINKNAFDLENNLGTELFRNGNIREAETHFRKSTELAPYWWTSWNNLGVVFERKNESDQAKEYYQKAIDNGNYYLAFENLAALKHKTEEPIENKKFLEESLKKLPQNPRLWLILSLTEYRLGNKESAIYGAQKSYQIQPSKDAAIIIAKLTRNEPLEIK